ncbi:MAG: hypothetical protein ACC682_11705, partial [Gemmatimonadota bacterium]
VHRIVRDVQQQGRRAGDAEERGGVGYQFLGTVGLLTPLANLTEDPASFGVTINVNVIYGLDATLWTSRHFGVGASGWYAPAQLQARDLAQGAPEIDLGSADYTVGTLQAIYRFVGSGSRSPLEPYLAAGAGIRSLSVHEAANPEVVNSTDPAGTVAGGVRLRGVISKMMIRLEIRDNFSMFESPTTGESRLQNDVLLSFGVGVRF